MLIIAKSVKGREFMYNAASARQVSKNSAKTILEVVNAHNYLLKDGEIWHMHEVDSYDNAYYYAQSRAFKIRKGVVKDCVI